MPELPEWQPLERIGETVAGGRSEGRIVGIVASESASTSGWAEHAALSVARAWSGAGQKVMLVDGVLERPTLHSVTGVENGEGLSDATLFGASVGRVAQSVEDGAFFLVTAGTAVADSHAVISSRRWDQISRSSVEAGVTLGLFLRDGDPGTPAFLGSASEIVVLAGRFDAPPASVRDLEPLVTLVTGPGGQGAAAVAEVDTPGTDVGELSAAALQQTAASGRGRLSLLVLLVLLLVVALLAVFGIIPIPGLSPQAAAPAAGPELWTGLSSRIG